MEIICLFFHVIPEDAPGGVPRRAGDVFQVWVVFDGAVNLEELASWLMWLAQYWPNQTKSWAWVGKLCGILELIWRAFQTSWIEWRSWTWSRQSWRTTASPSSWSCGLCLRFWRMSWRIWRVQHIRWKSWLMNNLIVIFSICAEPVFDHLEPNKVLTVVNLVNDISLHS